MLKIDQDKCIGCGLCAGSYPENFAMNMEGKAEVINPQVNDDNRRAVDDCPVEAISAK